MRTTESWADCTNPSHLTYTTNVQIFEKGQKYKTILSVETKVDSCYIDLAYLE